MSHEALNWAWKQRGLPAPVKLVLVALADTASEDDATCFPSARRLSEDCGLSRPMIWRHLRRLEKLDLVTRVQRHRETGQLTSNLYRLQLHSRTDETSRTDAPMDRCTNETGQSHVCTDHRCTGAIAIGAPVHQQEPPVEPPYEPEEEVPVWLHTLARDSRFPELATLNGFKERVEEFAEAHELNLPWEAEQAFLWLQEAKGKRKKDIQRFFMTWLGNQRKWSEEQARASPGRPNPHAEQVARDPDGAWRRG